VTKLNYLTREHDLKLLFTTIILPIRNEAAFIDRCLNSIVMQDYPSNYMEVLIVDGMSDDRTREIISGFVVLHPQMKIRILDNPGKIVPVGMNIALRQARGEIIIRVDGHCIIASDYVRRCVEHIQRDGVDGVGGSMESIGETQMAQAIAIGMSSPFGVGNSAFRTISGRSMLVDTVPFPAYTRQIIERAGLYDEELVRNQDDEYNYRIRELGGKILLAADVRSTYFSRASLKGLWRQYYQYGFWKVRVLQKHPRQMSLRQFAPPVFVLALFISILFFVFLVLLTLSSVLSLLSSVVPIAYLIANLAASIWTIIKQARAAHCSLFSTLYSLRLLPVIFSILHISYGLGFLVGLLKFAGRWDDKRGQTPPFVSQDA
jgi:succinoglycan biosynthesis protein ExoA